MKITQDRQRRISEIKLAIQELQQRFPKHSTPPSMLIELDDLEDELETLLAVELEGSQSDE